MTTEEIDKLNTALSPLNVCAGNFHGPVTEHTDEEINGCAGYFWIEEMDQTGSYNAWMVIVRPDGDIISSAPQSIMDVVTAWAAAVKLTHTVAAAGSANS